MDTYTYSSTELKNNTSEILNRVYYEKKTALVKKHGVVWAKIVPVTEGYQSADTHDLIGKYFGSIKDFPLVKERRYFRKRKISL